jgi:hypothetical protein
MEVYYVKTATIGGNSETEFVPMANRARMYSTVELAVKEIEGSLTKMTSPDYAWPGIKASFDSENFCWYADGPAFTRRYTIMRKVIREAVDFENPVERDEEVTGK